MEREREVTDRETEIKLVEGSKKDRHKVNQRKTGKQPKSQREREREREKEMERDGESERERERWREREVTDRETEIKLVEGNKKDRHKVNQRKTGKQPKSQREREREREREMERERGHR